MARAGITYHDVAKAAGKLSAEGKNPTVDNVRAALGDTGSRGTIAPLLKRWKEENQERGRAQANLPPELAEAVQALYERMQAGMQLQLDEQEATHREALGALQETHDKLAQEHGLLTATSRTQAEQLAALQKEYAILRNAHQEQALALARATTEIEGLSSRLADRIATSEDLARQLGDTRAQMAHYQEAAAQQRAEDRRRAEEREARLKQELEETQRRLLDRETLLAESQAEARQRAVQLADTTAALQAAQRAQADAQQLADQRGYRLAELEAATSTLKEANATLAKQAENARTELAVALAERRLIAESATRLENEKAGLQSQLQTCQQEKAALEADLRKWQSRLPGNPA